VRFPRVTLAVLLTLAAIAVAGCGGSDSGPKVENRPAPPASDFPSASGKTLADVVNQASGPSKLVLAPASSVFFKGEDRYSFGVFERDRTQVPDAQVALYVAKAPKHKAGSQSNAKSGKGPLGKAATALNSPASGPFTARVETLETEPAFRAKTTVDDPDAATAVYVTDLKLPSNGEWRIAALIKDGDQLTATLLPSATVGRLTAQFPGSKAAPTAKIPRVGEKAPRIHTPTPEDVGGDLSKITTRIPPDTMNKVDFYDELGKKPIVLLFATPQFCQSRVCGPVVDVAAQVQRDYGDKADFIHMEIYNDNDPAKGVRPQVRAFHLPSEPWLFVIDRNGVIRTEIEGAFSVDELQNAVKAVTQQ
jgi:hypothetical protein